jgi:predicted double-glycine peptidase
MDVFTECAGRERQKRKWQKGRRQEMNLGPVQRAIFAALLTAAALWSAMAGVYGAEKKKAPPPKPLPTEPPPLRDPEHRFQMQSRNYVRLKRENIVMQKRDFSCGAAALATIAKYYWGDNVDEDLFLRALDGILTDLEVVDRIQNGLAMTDLRRAAVRVGYEAAVGKLPSFDKLKDVKVPVIVGISPGGHDHFVVFRGTDDYWVYVADPIRGNVRMTVADFRKQWQENAVLVVHKPGQKVKETSPLAVRPEEYSLGELNDQLIRTQPQREAMTPNQTRRP